jgi:tetratricopeptide (TPR) repeat protein
VIAEVNQAGVATRVAAEAQAALNAGDTERARAGFEEAARQLEAGIREARSQSEKHLLRFLAATHYYKGGRYAKALALGRRVRPNLLPSNVRSVCRQFVRDAEERAAGDYEVKVRQALLKRWEQEDYAGVLGVLQEHPFVLPAGDLAFLRGTCCEALGDHQAALLFCADARKTGSVDPLPSLKAALANAKDNLPRRNRNGRRLAMADRRPSPVGTRASVVGLEALEEAIDDCLTRAKVIDRAGLENVVKLLRRARNKVVWKIGEKA